MEDGQGLFGIFVVLVIVFMIVFVGYGLIGIEANRNEYEEAVLSRPLVVTLTESDSGGWGEADMVYRCAEYERLDDGGHMLYDCIRFSNGPAYYEEVYVDGGTRISISK